jgi:hypothetical protein
MTQTSMIDVPDSDPRQRVMHEILKQFNVLKSRVKRLPPNGICPHEIMVELDLLVKRFNRVRFGPFKQK